MNKIERQKLNILNPAELARRLGIQRVLLEYHCRQGYVPRPCKKIGGRMYYTPQQSEIVKRYFEGRQRYQHHADVFAQ
jgi:predicted site-specific integrase-resolvase